MNTNVPDKKGLTLPYLSPEPSSVLVGPSQNMRF